jgi:hypothetical protein
MLLRRNYGADNNKTYLGLQVKCPKLLPGCNKIWSDSTNFLKSPNTKFRGNPFRGESRWYVQSDGRERSKHTLFTTVRTRPKWRSAQEMFSHACVSLFLTSAEILFRSIAQQFCCADTNSSHPLGQTPVNATWSTPAKREIFNILTGWPTCPEKVQNFRTLMRPYPPEGVSTLQQWEGLSGQKILRAMPAVA